MEGADTQPSSPSSAIKTPDAPVVNLGETPAMDPTTERYFNDAFYHLTITISQPWNELVEQTLIGGDKLQRLFSMIHTEPKCSTAPEDSTSALLDTENDSRDSVSAPLEASDNEDDEWLPNDDPDRNQTGFARLLGNPRFSDIELYVGPGKKLIKGHLAILAEKFEIFNSKAPDNCPWRPLKVDMTTFDYNSFQYILEYIYTGVISHPEHPSVVSEIYHQSLYLGVSRFTDHILDYIYELLETEIEYSDTISVEYIVTLIRGLQFRKITAPEARKRLKAIFELIVELVDFDKWLERDNFTSMLDEHPEVARVMLCSYSKNKLLKVRQEFAMAGIEDTIEHQKIIAKGYLPTVVGILNKGIADQRDSLEKLETTIKDLESHHEKLSK
ncbi:hypothetical protein TWF569_005970 [Orbilia oligospora]|nr:hypothetical protein TWF569_005970 [Orbilia oligospora]